MNPNFASRISKVPPYPFVEISRKIAAKKANGIDVISFGIGDPDIPTPVNVVAELQRASNEYPNHRYPETEGLPEFREAVADWYSRRFSVSLDHETEIISLIGAKEGIGHASLCFVEQGDIALVPDPGYPVYAVGTMFAGGESYTMPLLEERNWLPDLDSIPKEIAERATVMWLNYPNNPTGATAELDFFNAVVTFAKKYNIAVMHDACYSEVAYDGYRPVSFLQADGAIDIGMEFHSLSKSYNMTGWRLGMAVGNQRMIETLHVVKSNLDSGVPQAVQRMGIEALKANVDSVDERNAVYQNRKDRITLALGQLGLRVYPSKASLYIWAGVPDGYTSAGFADHMLEETDILVSAGPGYGEYGEGYIRLSITLSEEKLNEALKRISSWQISQSNNG